MKLFKPNRAIDKNTVLEISVAVLALCTAFYFVGQQAAAKERFIGQCLAWGQPQTLCEEQWIRHFD